MLSIETILHPTDFSDCSDFAFRLACALARDYGTRLVVFYVAEVPVAVGGDGMLILPPVVDVGALPREAPATPAAGLEGSGGTPAG